MPSNTHWVYKPAGHNPRFDHVAYAHFRDYMLRQTVIAFPERYREITNLSPAFRKSMPILAEMARELGLGHWNKVKMFRVPKGLRRNKNPIRNWRAYV